MTLSELLNDIPKFTDSKIKLIISNIERAKGSKQQISLKNENFDEVLSLCFKVLEERKLEKVKK